MTGDNDFAPDDILRQLRPARSDDYLQPGDDPRADALLQQIVSTDIRSRRSIGPMRVIILVVAGTAVVGATAAAAVVITRRAGNPTTFACYSSADTEHAVQFAIAPDPPRTPIEQCAELWSDGRIGAAGPPALVACVTHADIVAVLPGDQATCTAAGWTPADIAIVANPDAAAQLNGVLSNRFADQCLDAQAAVRATQDVLDQLGLTEWAVNDRTTPAGSCAVPVVDAPHHAVDVISLP